MNQSNQDKNPLYFYPDMPTVVTGRDAYGSNDDNSNGNGDGSIKRRGKKAKKDEYRLGERRYARLPMNVDEAFVKICKETGFEYSAMLRKIVIEFLKQNGRL